MGHSSSRDFWDALEAAAGRMPWPTDVDPQLRERAERLLARTRAAGSEPGVPKRALRKAMRVFRSARKAASARPTWPRLVFDSWFEPSPALRRAGPDATRFLRYEGPWRLELQVREAARGVELFGQMDPPAAAEEVLLEIGGKQRRAAIDAVGSFHLARLPRGAARLRIGDTTIEDVPL